MHIRAFETNCIESFVSTTLFLVGSDGEQDA